MRRWPTLVLGSAVVAVQGTLWLGPDNMPQVMNLERQLGAERAANAEASARNARTLAEVSDLKEGLEMVEEKARTELGMVKGDEVLVQVLPAGPPPPAAPARK
jgi:cell division protein FtsB